MGCSFAFGLSAGTLSVRDASIMSCGRAFHVNAGSLDVERSRIQADELLLAWAGVTALHDVDFQGGSGAWLYGGSLRVERSFLGGTTGTGVTLRGGSATLVSSTLDGFPVGVDAASPATLIACTVADCGTGVKASTS